MKVAEGREVGINGRRYQAGDELPDLAPGVVEQLREAGVIEAPAEEPAEGKAARGRRS